MGGTIALHLAQTRREDVTGIVVVNPSLFSTDPRLRLLPLLKFVVPGLAGIGNDIAKPGGDEKPYPKIPLRAFASFVQLQTSVRDRLADVTVPTLVFTSRHDHVVEPENGALVLNSIASLDKEQRWLERSYHVATLDYDLPEIVAGTAEFAERVAVSSR